MGRNSSSPAKKSGLEDIQRELKNSMQEPRQAQCIQPKNGEWLECTARCYRYECQHKPIQGKTREMVEEWPDTISKY